MEAGGSVAVGMSAGGCGYNRRGGTKGGCANLKNSGSFGLLGKVG